jgi:hypothetical protein
MPTTVREAPEIVYLGNEYRGYGSLRYVDVSATHLLPHVTRSCSETNMYIDSNAVPVYFCWDDTVTSWFGYTVKRNIHADVYVGDAKVGEANIEVVDSFGSSTLSYMLMLIMVMAIIMIIRYIARRMRG